MYLKDITRLLGKSLDSDEVQQLLSAAPFDYSDLLTDSGSGVRFLSSREKGIQLRLDERETVKIIFLYGRPIDGFSRFEEELSPGTPAASSRAAVLEAFGTPADSGSDYSNFLSQEPGVWDRYDIGNASFHIQYSPDGSHFELITIREIPKPEIQQST